jgi:hypothetical protein
VVPVLLLPWALARHGLRGFVLTAVALFLLVAVGAGPGSWLDWWTGVRESAPSPMSLASQLGISQFVVAGSAALVSVVLWLRFRGRDDILFCGGLVLVVLATSAFYFQALAMLAPILVVLPLRRRADSVVPDGREGQAPDAPAVAQTLTEVQ